MKIHNMSLALGIIGLIISFSSYYRWFIIYDDLSQALLGIFLGVELIVIAYFYNFARETDNKLNRLQIQADALGSKLFGLEKESIEELAKGH